MVCEELGLKEIKNFNQEMLRPDSIYLLDFESEAFIWVGKSVPKDILVESYKLALNAMENIHCCGKARINRVTLSLVSYAYEPRIFKSAFKSGWIDFARPDQALSGAIKEENSDGDSEEEQKVDTSKSQIDEKTLKQAQMKLPNNCWLN